MILKDVPTQTLNWPQMMPFNPFFEEEGEIKPTSSRHSPLRKNWPALRKGASLPGSQHTPCLRARLTTAKTKKSMKGVCRLVSMKRISMAVDGARNVHCGLADNFALFKLAVVEQKAEEEWMDSLLEESIKTLRDSALDRCRKSTRSLCRRICF